MYLSYLLCINKFGLTPSASCPVKETSTTKSLPWVSVSKGCTSVFEPQNHVHINIILSQEFNNNNNRIQRRYSRVFTISSQRHELSPTRTLKWPGRSRVQITCNTSSAYHLQVLCYVSLGTKGQLSYLLSLTKLKSHLFELYFIG